MRVERIPWKPTPRPTKAHDEPPPWAGRALGALLLLLALTVIYHGSSGRKALTQLAAYLTGQRAQPATAPARPPQSQVEPSELTVITQGLANLPPQIQAGNWRQAQSDLAVINTSWDVLSGKMVRVVPTFDINNFTVLLSNVGSDVVAHNVRQALQDIHTAQAALGWMATAYLASRSPTMQELAQLVDDLNRASRARSWSRVAQDARALAELVREMQHAY